LGAKTGTGKLIIFDISLSIVFLRDTPTPLTYRESTTYKNYTI